MIRLQNIGVNGFQDTDHAFVSKEYFDSLNGHDARPGDLLVAALGDDYHPPGRACILPKYIEVALVKADCFRVRLNPNIAHHPYVAYWINSAEGVDHLSSRSKGTTRTRISLETLRELRVPLPPLATQQAIADYLDDKTAAIDALIEKKRKLLDLLAEERASLINQAVTKGLDPNVPMKDSGIPWIGEIPAHWDVLQLRRRITLQRGVDITKEQQSEGSVPVVSSGGVSSYHDTALIEGPGVVVGRKGSAGTVHWVEEDFWPHDTTLYVKRFGDNVRRFVYYKLIALQLETYDTGSANPTVNRNLVHPVQVSWPTTQEQEAIVEHLDQTLSETADLAKRTRKSVDRLQEYRQALITAAVTGQLDIEAAA